MTSQVAIFNLNGIAVASDTVSTSTTNQGSKTTNNAEKIYPLGDGHLVVAVHFGGTAINDLHHQFHFNRWVESLKTPFSTLEEYLSDYVEWTGKNQLHTAGSENVEITSIIYDHFEELLKRTQEEVVKSSPESPQEFLLEQLHHHAKVGLEYLKKLPKMEGITLEAAKKVIIDRKIDVKQIFENAAQKFWVFENHTKLTTSINRILSQSAPYTLIGDQSLFWDSNLAFIGYGSKDHFGSSIKIRFRSIIDNHLIYSREPLKAIEPGAGQSRIQPFAQSDAIESFIQGYNDDIMTGVTWAIKKKGGEISEELSEDLLNQIAEATKEYIEGYSWKSYVRPMLNQISGMNLFGMSELARTLVGLQATSSESKDGPVSVGGLIEVLTIDRTNGIQWRSKLP